jgi:predicted transcriptional regulator of viral defense system
MTIGEIVSDITEKILKKFQSKRLVRWKEIADFLQDQVKATTAVQWLLKSGKAISVKKGLYYLKRPNEWLQDELEINPLLIAGYLHPEAVIGYHAALKCYGAAYSESNVFQIALPKSIRRAWKTFSFQKAYYEFYRTNLTFGVASSVIEDVRVQHFSRERILLEGLRYPDRFLGMEEFLKSIEGFSWINLEHLFEMVKHYPIKTISMRLGWLLEKNKQKWHVEESDLKKLEKNRTESRILLIKNKPKGNYLVKRWSLMVPRSLRL